ncbi:MAG: hypothetical protein EA378_08365 [Phycisphaerales bacterium]|nr:MAG: hypothetical protein EA378_08365 [Phycisphaerales bacterium]
MNTTDTAPPAPVMNAGASHEPARAAASMIQYGLLVAVLAALLFGILGAVLATGEPPRSPGWIQIIGQLLGLVGGVMFFTGIIRFAPIEPKPRDGGRVLRGLAFAMIALTVFDFLLTGVGVLLGSLVLVGLSTLPSLANIVISLILVVLLMIRVREWGETLGDDRLAKRAHLNRILIPLLMTVGVLILIGPLIGLVLFYNTFDALRKALAAPSI